MIICGSISDLIEEITVGCATDMVATDVSLVIESVNLLRRTSTSKPKFVRKSAPIIGRETLATIKFQSNLRRRPMSNDKRIFPNVSIRELFAAKSFILDGLIFIFFDMGTTDISAPVSTRKDRFEFLS